MDQRMSDIVYFFEPHHPCMLPSLKYFINLSMYKNGNSIPLYNCFDISTIHYKLSFNIFIPLCCWIVEVSFRFWVEASNLGPDERRNMIGWSKAGQLQMDQSAAVFCLTFRFFLQFTSGMFTSATFSTVYVLFSTFWGCLKSPPCLTSGHIISPQSNTHLSPE